MAFPQRLSHVLAGVLAGAAVAGGGFALAATTHSRVTAGPTNHVIHACVDDHTRAVDVRDSCGRGSRAIAWNEKGERGLRGAMGLRGVKGERGVQGATGAAGKTGAAATVPWGALAPWNDTATYTAGPPASVVTYDGGTYVAAVTNTNVAPSPTSADWEQIAAPGLTGSKGSTGAAGTANAWGEIWPTDNDDAGVIATGSQNVVSFHYVSVGCYEVTVSGCTAPSPAEAAIEVTAGADPNDPAQVDEQLEMVADAGGQLPVAGHADELSFYVTLDSLGTGQPTDGDFSFTVNC